MGYSIYLCPRQHVELIADGGAGAKYCQYIVNTDRTGEYLCGAHPLTEVTDPQQILTLAQGLDLGTYYGREDVHILADTALWKRMLQLDREFAVAYLRLLHEHDWGY